MNGSHPTHETVASTCPKAPQPDRGRWSGAVWLVPIVGLASLIWFLVRVIPKPSRATYPCQRMAFPMASGFVIWLMGLVTTVGAYRTAKALSRRRWTRVAAVCAVIAAAAGLHTVFNMPVEPAQAAYNVPQTANTPIGIARGVAPGRVVWIRDADATDFLGAYQGDGYWWEARHNDQAAVDNMMSLAIRGVAGTTTDEAAWDAIFRHFNQTHGRGDVGYTAGDKINIKLNLVAQADHNDGRVNLTTYVQTKYQENVSVSPWMALALLRQLVYKAGVPQEDISIGDAMCFWPAQYWDPCHGEFPNVVYLDRRGLCGRTAVAYSDHRFYWSKTGVNPRNQDYVPLHNAQATYFINFANLKAHEGGGITLCGKNYYGALIRTPSTYGYYELHGDLPFNSGSPGFGRYRTMTDFIAHPDFGGKGLLYLIDGLWGGNDAGTRPTRWYMPPFNGDWPSSLLASMDPVAIDSVGLDACKAEVAGVYLNPTHYKYVTAPDDYLHEAALVENPPSGTFYDPDRSGVVRASLGVHEHWNNNTDRQYTRNLGTGEGIELLWYDVGDPGDVNRDGQVNAVDLLMMAHAWTTSRGQPGFVQNVDLNFDGMVNVLDLLELAKNWNVVYP